MCFLKSCLFILNLKPTIPLNVRRHHYSTKAKGVSLPIESRLHPNLNSFYDWFCGLADAESCFFFRIRERAVEFEFKISLHLDDLPVILFIQKNLGIGKVDTSGMASFRVNKQSELLILIEIFEKFPLNSTKYLNYLDFKKALELYVLSKSALTKKEISKLKARMNSLRTDFTMPNSHKLRITPEWVLGFTEGEGCFSVQKIFPFSVTFSLTQKNNTDLMRAIQKFFQSLAVRFNLPNEQEAVRISLDSRIGNKGDITSLHISRTDYLTLVLIPFFDSLTWGSKKENDYNDWKTILQLKKLGLHYTEKGVTIINLIISQMNLNRSSTNAAKMSQPQLDALKDDIVKLLAGPSNLEEKKDGRIFIKSLNKYYTGSGSIKIELQNKDGLVVNTFGSISECAKFLGLAPLTVTTRLQKNMPIVLNDNVVFVKKRLKQDLVASKNLEPPGPKFIYKNPPTLGYTRLPLAPCDNDSESHKGLPYISTRREPPKAKLAFILPNFKPDKRIGPHNEDVISLLGGSLLGNGHAEREKNGGVRFIFKKSEAYKEYMFWLYEFFNKRGYCTNNLPVVCKHGGASCQSMYYSFVTHSFTSLIWLYKSFYNHKKQKKIPVNIADILTPLSLAVWISDKGFFHYPSLLIHTQNFSKQEVRLLSLALETKFNIKSTLWSERRGFALAHESRRSTSQIKSSYLLVIKVEHMPLLRKLLTPHMEPSMLYKLGL